MTTERRPLHVAVVFGLTTGLYAGSLAMVTALQASTERALAAGRAPVAAGAESLGDSNDRLVATLDRSVAAYQAAASAYGDLTQDLVGFEDRLTALGGSVAGIQGAVAELPSRIALPSVRTVSRASSRSAPATHAKTSASGAP